MVTFFLERKDGRPLEYRAGQFLTFLFSFHGRELRRSYSFSSTPGIDLFPSITVKREVNGEISRFLVDRLRVGDVLSSLAPAGKFLLEAVPDGSLVFLAAGSGMVPVFSLMKAAFHQRAAKKIILISQNRDSESIPFRSALEEMREDPSGLFEWTSLLSRPTPIGNPVPAARLNNGLLKELLDWIEEEVVDGAGPDITNKHLFYLCGPLSFMRMALFTLRLMGVSDRQIRKENFTVEYVPPPPFLADTSPKEVVILTNENRYEFATAWPSTILQSALAHHIALPYSCKGGRCSTCMARCVSGKVKMSINEVLTDKDLQEGWILTCVGYAETDIELDFP